MILRPGHRLDGILHYYRCYFGSAQAVATIIIDAITRNVISREFGGVL